MSTQYKIVCFSGMEEDKTLVSSEPEEVKKFMVKALLLYIGTKFFIDDKECTQSEFIKALKKVG